MRQSSLEAYEGIKSEKSKHWEIIIAAMQVDPNSSLTSKQISALTRGNLSYHEVARRLNEMENEGMIKVVGREPNIKNRPLLWKLTNKYKTYQTGKS
ncbi:hypothetical protein [Spongiimicrobium salis]|uniref:hypothetical protein n=1 Tax=Spongiimicrobium salis TaxID=1667022 RepID=UPI00374CDF42